MSNEATNKKKKYTFFELLEDFKIVIPIIQRDYAQGREDEISESIRKSFIDTIDESLGNNKKLELDFIFGSTKLNKEKNIKELSLLDGQQRLTTLFLLHWYFAKKEGKLDKQTKEILKKFSYSNRTSSEDFCKELIEKGIEIPSGTPKEGKQIIKKIIKEQIWYYSEWDNEPTIKSMINMLDTIHLKLYNKNYFEKLKKNISFYFQEMEEFGLTDELYIKMNSRGKQLTDFENFKAEIIKILRNKSEKGNNKAADLLKRFEKNIETKWVEFIWDYKEFIEEKDDEKLINIDSPFIRYIFVISELIYDLRIRENGNEDIVFPKYVDNLPVIDFTVIKKIYSDIENIRMLADILDLWRDKQKTDEDFSKIFSSCYKKGKVTLFRNKNDEKYSNLIDKCMHDELEINERLILFSYILRKLQYKDEDKELENYMRVIRNLIEERRSFVTSAVTHMSDVRSNRNYTPYLRFIDKNLVKSDNIYESILNIDEKEEIKNGPRGAAIELEKRKAKIMKQHKELLNSLEDKAIIKGMLFNFIDFIEQKPDKIKRFIEMFETTNLYNLIYRAFLSINDYGIDIRRDKYFYGNSKENMYDIITYKDSKNIKSIIDILFKKYSSKNYDKYEDFLQEIINENIKKLEKSNWRYAIVRSEELFAEQENHDYILSVKTDEHLVKNNVNVNYLTGHKNNSKHINIYYIPLIKKYNLKESECYTKNKDRYGAIVLNENDIKIEMIDRGIKIETKIYKDRIKQMIPNAIYEKEYLIIEYNNEEDYITQIISAIEKIRQLQAEQKKK